MLWVQKRRSAAMEISAVTVHAVMQKVNQRKWMVKMVDQNIKVPQDILIWDSNIGFIQILEGDGSNLHQEDIDNGYADYMLVNFYKYSDGGVSEIGNFQALLTELYQEQFTTARDVVNYLIKCEIIQDANYTYLNVPGANVKCISENDRYYGTKRLQHMIDRLKKRLASYEGANLSVYGYVEVGKLKEAISIYEDMLDHWEEAHVR